jgi:hypothetical protein
MKRWEIFFTGEGGVKIISNNVFDVDGIRFGLEICLDHRRNVFWERLQEDNENLVDVHHVISAGMVLDLGAVPICSGGVAYLTDGTGLSAACLRTDNDKYDPQNICQEGPAGLEHVPAFVSNFYSWDTAGFDEITLAFFCDRSFYRFNPPDAEWKSYVNGYHSNYATQGYACTLNMEGVPVNDENEMKFYHPMLLF